MELVEIVDEKGILTGEVLELELAHKKSLLHEAVVIFIINGKGEVLLGKRSKEEKLETDKWGLLAGHVDAYEPKEVTVQRELKEEINLDVRLEDIKRIGEKEINLEKHNAHLISFYYIKKDFDLSICKLKKDEITQIKWFKIDDVIKLIKEKDKDIITRPNRLYLFSLIKKL